MKKRLTCFIDKCSRAWLFLGVFVMSPLMAKNNSGSGQISIFDGVNNNVSSASDVASDATGGISWIGKTLCAGLGVITFVVVGYMIISKLIQYSKNREGLVDAVVTTLAGIGIGGFVIYLCAKGYMTSDEISGITASGFAN